MILIIWIVLMILPFRHFPCLNSNGKKDVNLAYLSSLVTRSTTISAKLDGFELKLSWREILSLSLSSGCKIAVSSSSKESGSDMGFWRLYTCTLFEVLQANNSAVFLVGRHMCNNHPDKSRNEWIDDGLIDIVAAARFAIPRKCFIEMHPQ